MKFFSDTLLDPKSVVVIFNTSIKKNITTSILHIHFHPNKVNKTIHYTVNDMSTKAKLFAMRCGINQVVQTLDASHVIIITNAIHLVLLIFCQSCEPWTQLFLSFSFLSFTFTFTFTSY